MTQTILVLSAFLLVAVPAGSAPVARLAAVTFELALQGLTPISVTAVSSVTVDSTAGNMGMGKISLAAGVLTLSSTIVLPLTSNTALASLTIKTLSNLSGMFSVGGAGIGNHGSETPCPASLAGKLAEACVAQTGFGGKMAVTGTIAVHVIPDIVVIPVNLNHAQLGQGGYTTTPLDTDAAPWTRKTGQIVVGGTPPTTITTVGTTSAAASSFTLVTPIFFSAVGFLPPTVGRLSVAFLDGGGLPTFVNKTVPEPGTLLLVGLSGLGMAIFGRGRG